MVLLANASTEAAAATLERLRESIESPMRDVTASIGAVACQPAPISLEVIRAADSAMYLVKRSGKNRVLVAMIDLHACSRTVAGSYWAAIRQYQ